MRLFIVAVAVLHSCIISIAQDHIHFEETSEGNQATQSETNFKCGLSNPGGLVFRFGDGHADFGEFPWMVAIIKISNSTSNEWREEAYVSAGTLIHPSVVLTSSFALDKIKPNELKCRTGEWDKRNEDESYAYQERNVRRIVNHQDFLKDSFYNSVSLVFLEKPFALKDAPHVGAACVGQTLPFPGTHCFGTGWGHTSATKKTDILKKIPVTLLSADDCQTKLRQTRLGKLFHIHDSLTCASSADDTCKGDKGAPLVCPVEGESTRYVLYGMSAYRVEQNGAPCTYVNVPVFYSWIGERMAEEGFSSNSYTYVPTI